MIGSSSVRPALRQASLKANLAGELEGDLRAVDRVVAAVDQRDLDVDQRIVGQHAGLGGHAGAVLDRGNVFLGDRSAEDLVLEGEVRLSSPISSGLRHRRLRRPSKGSMLIVQSPNWPRPPDCLTCLPRMPRRLAGDGFLVGDLRACRR